MTELDRLLNDNAAVAAAHRPIGDARPRRHLAVVTCMDARIDVRGVLDLELGDAHILRNAGGRVTDDVLRSLALSVHILGVQCVVVMEHTGCGLWGTTDQALRSAIGAQMEFLAIDDHRQALRGDVERLAATPFLAPVTEMAGLLFDTVPGTLEVIVHLTRP